MTLYHVTFDAKTSWKPDPYPGGREARMQGCSCPGIQPAGNNYIFDSDCKVHELEEVPKQ